MRLYLGTHKPHWLEFVDVPLFVSHRSLREMKHLPRAKNIWALDSCGFTELSKHGQWTISEEEYIAAVRRYMGEIGSMSFCATQDWMCEEDIIKGNPKKGFKGTGLSIPQHQELSVLSFLSLRQKCPEAPWLPVLQGWHPDDYLRHIEMYEDFGVDLFKEPYVGVGSVCRRQGTEEGVGILKHIYGAGIRTIHAFGFKTLGLVEGQYYCKTSDSLAWSFGARRRHTENMCATHAKCANCEHYALSWRQGILDRLELQSDMLDSPTDRNENKPHVYIPFGVSYFREHEKRPVVSRKEDAQVEVSVTYSCKHRDLWLFGGATQDPRTTPWSGPRVVEFPCSVCEKKKNRNKEAA